MYIYNKFVTHSFFYLMVLTDIVNTNACHTAGNWCHCLKRHVNFLTHAKMTLQYTINNGYVGRQEVARRLIKRPQRTYTTAAECH